MACASAINRSADAPIPQLGFERNMSTNRNRLIVVFGGTGFLGRRVVRHLRERHFPVRIASRDSDKVARSGDDSKLESVQADIGDARSIAQALVGAYGVVNAVSLYVERGKQSFHAVHVEAAERLAALADRAGAERLVHVSGIGADPGSPSLYIRKRGEGEQAVRREFAATTIIRPAVMVGPDDAFLTRIVGLVRKSPIYPLFGKGAMRLQPADVEDVGEAVARVFERFETRATTFECGGPQIYTYRDLVVSAARLTGSTPLIMPVPFLAWTALAGLAERLPRPPLTRNQVELMRLDNVVSLRWPGFPELNITPSPVEGIARQIVQSPA
jgi:NADH dehydrogenase